MAPDFSKAMSEIDAAHALDPTPHTLPSGETIPYELHYAQKCTAYLNLRLPSAPPTLQLAVRAQHFRRWEVPRSSYPDGKAGYLSWRAGLKKRMSAQVEELCAGCGYSAEEAADVGRAMRKEGLKSRTNPLGAEDGETQVLEDVACLVFLDDQFEAFEKEHDEDKIVRILKMTWGKMSEKGHKLALGIQMSDRAIELVGKALGG
jgi:Domain of unknown function (DUF4202)